MKKASLKSIVYLLLDKKGYYSIQELINLAHEKGVDISSGKYLTTANAYKLAWERQKNWHWSCAK